MNNKIKIVMLLFLVNSLWAMSRFGPLSSQSLSSLRRYVPGNVSAVSHRTLSSSGRLSQPFPSARIKAIGQVVGGARGGISPRIPGAARKIALLEKKLQQATKEQAPEASIFSKFRAYDKKIQESLKESFVGTSLLGVGVMIGGRSLYDKYIANKDSKPELIPKKDEVQTSEPAKIMPKNLNAQEEQSGWTDFKNAIANRWNAIFANGVTGNI